MTEITRQHLEDAALAAGYGMACTADGYHRNAPFDVRMDGLMLFGVQEEWRPHLDDGDAFRLAVALSLAVEINSDVSAAREAIVLCAAEVGRRMREAKA